MPAASREGIFLDSGLSAHNAVEQRPIQPHVAFQRGIVEIDRIARLRRIEALANELGLFPFEGWSDVHFFPESKEQGIGIRRQPLRDMTPQKIKIDCAVRDQSRHAGTPLGFWNRDAINGDISDSGERRNRLLDLERGDVLALPAETIADTIHEIPEARLI